MRKKSNSKTIEIERENLIYFKSAFSHIARTFSRYSMQCFENKRRYRFIDKACDAMVPILHKRIK